MRFAGAVVLALLTRPEVARVLCQVAKPWLAGLAQSVSCSRHGRCYERVALWCHWNHCHVHHLARYFAIGLRQQVWPACEPHWCWPLRPAPSLSMKLRTLTVCAPPTWWLTYLETRAALPPVPDSAALNRGACLVPHGPAGGVAANPAAADPAAAACVLAPHHPGPLRAAPDSAALDRGAGLVPHDLIGGPLGEPRAAPRWVNGQQVSAELRPHPEAVTLPQSVPLPISGHGLEAPGSFFCRAARSSVPGGHPRRGGVR